MSFIKTLNMDIKISINKGFCDFVAFNWWNTFNGCTPIFDIKVILQINQTTWSHTSRCHCCDYCKVDFMFCNVICYTNSLLPCIHANTTCSLKIVCTLVVVCMILGMWKCIWVGNNEHVTDYKWDIYWSMTSSMLCSQLYLKIWFGAACKFHIWTT